MHHTLEKQAAKIVGRSLWWCRWTNLRTTSSLWPRNRTFKCRTFSSRCGAPMFRGPSFWPESWCCVCWKLWKLSRWCQVLNNMKKKWAAKAAAWLDKGIAERLPWTHRFLVPAAMRAAYGTWAFISWRQQKAVYVDGCQMKSVTQIAFVSPEGRASKIGHGQNCVSAWSTEWWSSVLPLWFSS